MLKAHIFYFYAKKFSVALHSTEDIAGVEGMYVHLHDIVLLICYDALTVQALERGNYG